MKDYPGRLYHETPSWVENTALFHVRIRVERGQAVPLIEPILATALLQSAQRYHELGRWNCILFLIMPDHVHALLSFADHADLSVVMKDWKRGTARFQAVAWQENFFDHRIRNEKESGEKWHYVRNNPVVKGLCADKDDWPWWWSGRV